MKPERPSARRPAPSPEDLLWRALGSPSRRAVLELLRAGPRTTGEIAAALPGSRYAAMKHLAILVEAGLVAVERRGRERWNRLDARVLSRILRRWAARYGGAGARKARRRGGRRR